MKVSKVGQVKLSNAILLLGQCSEEADWAAGVIYLPLR
jgi:hypothetical protein